MGIRVAAWLGSQFLLALICTAQVKTSALIESGKRELDNGQFTAAADSFRKATEIDPGSEVAYELLARALVGQVPYNLRLLPDLNGALPEAKTAAKKAVDLAPSDASAWCALGLVDQRLADAARDPKTRAAELTTADQAFNKALLIEPMSYEAHYELGKMALDTAMEPLLAARHRSGVPFGKPGRIQDPGILKSMQERYRLQIEVGIDHTQHALTINSRSWSAMHQMAGLLNEQSLIEDSDEKAKADRDLSMDWQKKSESAKPVAPAKPVSSEQLATATALSAIMNAPSSLPPGQRSGTMLVLLPEQAEEILVKKVDPVYPESTKPGDTPGEVRFRIWVNKEGRVKRVDFLSGDPELVNSARDAVRKWEFKPLVVNGETQEFMTTAVLRFVR